MKATNEPIRGMRNPDELTVMTKENILELLAYAQNQLAELEAIEPKNYISNDPNAQYWMGRLDTLRQVVGLCSPDFKGGHRK